MLFCMYIEFSLAWIEVFVKKVLKTIFGPKWE
jgi:hypothetical protein